MGFLFILGWLLLGLLGGYFGVKAKSPDRVVEVRGDDLLFMIICLILGPIGFLAVLLAMMSNSSKVFFTIGKEDE